MFLTLSSLCPSTCRAVYLYLQWTKPEYTSGRVFPRFTVTLLERLGFSRRHKMLSCLYIRLCTMPVSYTHLDVYKRQLLKQTLNFPFLHKLGNVKYLELYLNTVDTLGKYMAKHLL